MPRQSLGLSDAAEEALGYEQYQRLFARGAAMSYEEVLEFAPDHVQQAVEVTTTS